MIISGVLDFEIESIEKKNLSNLNDKNISNLFLDESYTIIDLIKIF